MVNLLKSDFYRLLKSKSLYICAAVGAFLMMISLIAVKLLSTMPEVSDEMPFPGALDFGHVIFTGADVHLLMAIFISIFVTAEFVHGTMKNTISKGYSRTLVYLSKIITSTVASYFIMLVMFIVSVATYMVIYGELGSLSGKEILIIFIELLLHTALASVFVLIAMVVRNNGGTIAINIICITLIFPQIFNLLDAIFDLKINFRDYSLVNNITMYYGFIPLKDDIIRSVIVGVVYLVFVTLLGIIVFKKKDVK